LRCVTTLRPPDGALDHVSHVALYKGKSISDVSEPRLENLCTEGAEGVGLGAMPFPHNFFTFFHFKIVHSCAFSYSKVLFAIKCRERYVIVVFLASDSDTVFINLVNPVQSVISNSRRFHIHSRHVL